MPKLTWTRTKKTIGRTRPIETGESVYTSSCGRFVIHQRRFGSRTDYLLDVDGAPASRVWREHDSLASAKWAANSITNPSCEG